MSDFDYWTWLTLGLGVLLVAFGIWEWAAIRGGHREWTYTVKIRGWLGIEPPAERRLWASAIFAFVLIVFTGWFVPHIVLGWWGGAP